MNRKELFISRIKAIKNNRTAYQIGIALDIKGNVQDHSSKGYAAIGALTKLGIIYHNKPRYFLLQNWKEIIEKTKYKDCLKDF